MKKIFLSLTLLLTLCSYSQNSKIKFGFQAGLNYSNFRGYTISTDYNQYYNESPAFSFLVGATFEYKLKEKLSLRVELNYERKSQSAKNMVEISESFEEPSQIYNYTTRKNYNYIIVPILLKYNLKNKNSFYVNGGPFIGYLIKSNVTSDLVDAPQIHPNEMITTELNKKSDFGLSIGFGKNFDLKSNKQISIEIRENLGLAKTNEHPVWNDGHVKTNSLNLIVGLSFL